MIEALKSEEIFDKVGGRFRTCALIQRRLVELMDGARPLIERNGRTDLEVAVEEIMQGKIEAATEMELLADATEEQTGA
jgi:DNA-directed RNA polymerase subunit omega